jgi:hypothetical protein
MRFLRRLRTARGLLLSAGHRRNLNLVRRLFGGSVKPLNPRLPFHGSVEPFSAGIIHITHRFQTEASRTQSACYNLLV